MRIIAWPVLTAAGVLALACWPIQGAWSDNLVGGGDFEDTAYLKTSGSLDSSDVHVPIHRFNRDTDLGMWLAQWGPPSQADNPAALAGFSLYDDPRADAPGDTQQTGDLGNMNRSVDPLNPGNHVMENTMFRPTWGQWMAAPANHVAGPISFSFDFNHNKWWTPPTPQATTWLQAYLVGSNNPPPHDVSIFGNEVFPHKDNITSGVGDLLAYWEWRWWYQSDATVEGGRFDVDVNGKWTTLSTDNPDFLWDLDGSIKAGGVADVLTAEVAEPYPYYAVYFYNGAYGEDHVYFWLYSPDAHIADSFAQGVDNVVLKVTIEDGVGIPDPVPADFSIDALVNTEDINPFILALTNTTAWLNYARPLLPDGLTDQQIIDYADPNGDGSINTEDIAWFICWLTTPGSCGGGGGAIIPEPASLGLLGLGALALIRRRR